MAPAIIASRPEDKEDSKSGNALQVDQTKPTIVPADRPQASDTHQVNSMANESSAVDISSIAELEQQSKQIHAESPRPRSTQLDNSTPNGQEQYGEDTTVQADATQTSEPQNIVADQRLPDTTQDQSSNDTEKPRLSYNGSMPPPAAPASMLYTLRASVTAKQGSAQVDDPFICSRLALAAVTLFRMGKAKEAKAVGQFGVDLLGEQRWHEWQIALT